MEWKVLYQNADTKSIKLKCLYKTFAIFFLGYVFLSGFVFIEPSPAEIWFLIFVPFLLLHFRTTFELLLIFETLFLPMLTSAFVGSIVSGYYNLRFIAIDVYLFFFFLMLASYFATKGNEFAKEHFFNSLMKSWAIAGGINILAGLFVYATGFTFPYAKVVNMLIRLQGFFKDPNVLGPFLVPITLYYLRRFFGEKRKSNLYLILFGFFSIGVLLTFSRAAWLNYLSTLIFYFAFVLRKKKTFMKLIFFVFILLILLPVLLSIIKNIYVFNVNLYDYLTARSKLQSYDEGRFEAQRAFTEITFSTSLLFGTGPGNYERFTAGYSTHSLYFRYIGERGILGLVTFVMFIVLTFRKAARSEMRDFLVPALIGQLINSLFIDSLHWRHFWILLALSFL